MRCGFNNILFSALPTASFLSACCINHVPAASADGHYGWQVQVMTLAANPDGIYGWQVESRPLLSNLDGIYVSNSLAANMG